MIDLFFNNLTDDEFETYLKNKYVPLYGPRWILYSLTDEEFERYKPIIDKKITIAMDTPFWQNYLKKYKKCY